MRAMILKELRELRRDRRTVGLLVGMPLLLLVIFSYAANFYVSSVQAAVVGKALLREALFLTQFLQIQA